MINRRPSLFRSGFRAVSARKRDRCPGRLVPFLALAALLAVASTIFAEERAGTLEAPIVDSRMTREQAVYRGGHPDAPRWILQRQAVVEVCYRGFDGRVLVAHFCRKLECAKWSILLSTRSVD